MSFLIRPWVMHWSRIMIRSWIVETSPRIHSQKISYFFILHLKLLKVKKLKNEREKAKNIWKKYEIVEKVGWVGWADFAAARSSTDKAIRSPAEIIERQRTFSRVNIFLCNGTLYKPKIPLPLFKLIFINLPPIRSIL